MSNGSFRTKLGALLLAGLATTAYATPATIENAAREFLTVAFAQQLQPGDTLKLQFNRIDPRLQLNPCSEPVRFSHPRALTPGAFQLIARCNTPRQWQLRLGGKAEIYRSLWLSSTPLIRGTTLAPEHLTQQPYPVSQLRGDAITNPIQWYGHTLRQNMPAGTPLRSDLLDAPIVVQKGDALIISAGQRGVRVEAPGVALEDGRTGEQIRVENSRSGRAVRARVVGPGRVESP